MNRVTLLTLCIGLMIYVMIRIRRRQKAKRRNVVIVNALGEGHSSEETIGTDISNGSTFGLALARQLYLAGDSVVLCVRTELCRVVAMRVLKQSIIGAHGRFSVIVIDHTKGEELTKLCSEAREFFFGHRIDIWINNVAPFRCTHTNSHPNSLAIAELSTRAALRMFSIQHFAKHDTPCKIFNVLPPCGCQTNHCALNCRLIRSLFRILAHQVTREEIANPKLVVCHTIDTGIIVSKQMFGNCEEMSKTEIDQVNTFGVLPTTAAFDLLHKIRLLDSKKSKEISVNPLLCSHFDPKAIPIDRDGKELFNVVVYCIRAIIPVFLWKWIRSGRYVTPMKWKDGIF